MKARLPALTAVAALLLTATIAAAPAALAAPGDPNQVALIVQKDPGSPLETWCVNYRDGMSGADVLSAADPVYGAGPYAGFVLQINEFGNTKSTPPTNSRYWAYWRGNSSGSYSYSSGGVTSTAPPAGSVEAWVWYDNGEVDFPHRSYASICPGGYEQAAAPTAAANPVTPKASAPAPPRAATPTPSDTAAAPTTSAPVPTAAPTTPTAATPSTAASTAGVGRSVDASPVAMSTDTGGSGTPLGVALAAVAVVALGAAAVWQRRRRSAADE